MPESKQSSSNLGASGVAWILLAAAGTYFVVHTPPLEGNRPPTTEAFLRAPPSVQDVDSRLWQDPFAAIVDKLTKSTDLKPENCDVKIEVRDHCVSPLSAASDPASPPPIVIAASVTGAPYSEDHEFRRRIRYAIGAGLDRQGFVPRDPEHLGFFWPRAVAEPHTRLPDVVPFEWFDRKTGRAHGVGTKDGAAEPFDLKNSPVLLLWFDEGVFSESPPHPLKGYDEFFCRILRAGVPSAYRWGKALVLGPESSTTLRAMADEIADGTRSNNCPQNLIEDKVDSAPAQDKRDPLPSPPTFYVFSATAADTVLIRNSGDLHDKSCPAAGDHLSNFFRGKNVGLYRMTATDAALAHVLRDELSLRRPHRFLQEVRRKLPGPLVNFFGYVKGQMPETLIEALGFIDDPERDHVVLVSEWDTFYGQSLPEAMAGCLRPEKGAAKEASSNETDDPFVHRYSYLRGLDGQMPNVDGPNSGNLTRNSDKSQDASDNQGKGDKDRAKNTPGAKPNDRPEGQGQYDYLRRLGEQIGALDDRLRSGVDKAAQKRSRNGIRAVGVLGSDRYDKLLILQALRSLLPNAVFFTTDLDALVLHPTARPYTRNLLVASSFGLHLDDDLQREIPPFRSSYQTAAFLAAQAAVQGADGQPCTWNEPALLFEVGLSSLFQISSATNDRPKLGESACEPLGRHAIHPDASEMFPTPGRGYPVAIAAAIIVLGLGVTASCKFLRRKTWSLLEPFLEAPASRIGLIARAAVLFGGLGLLIVGIAWTIVKCWQPAAAWLTDDGDGQPMIWLNGISIWPTIVLRAAIWVLCLVLFVHAFRWLSKDFDRVATSMGVKDFWDHLEHTERNRQGRPWTRFLRYFSYPMRKGTASDYKERFWGPYIYQGTWPARISRTVAAVVAFFALWGVLELVFGNPPTPTRGPTSFWFYTGISALLNATTLFLTLFVADATLLYRQVIKALVEETDNRPNVWPDATLSKFDDRVGLPQGDLEHWVDLVFISKRTKCITTLIYFPFIVVALVIISRSGLFANYAPSLPEMLVMALGLLVVTGSAIALRQAAEASRGKAHRRLNDQIMRAKQSQAGDYRATQLELLSHRVEELNEGALTPFTQQPLLRAMLLPLGSFGGTALVEYLLLPGLS